MPFLQKGDEGSIPSVGTMKKSIWCRMDFHKWGKPKLEQVLFMGFPTDQWVRHCTRDGCTCSEVKDYGVVDFGGDRIEVKPDVEEIKFR
jgi:hypothetical protein